MIYHLKPGGLPATLRALRERAGLTCDQAAQALGFRSQATISHYETGRRKIPLDLLPEFARVYDVEIEIVVTVSPMSGKNS
ncbi:MAG: helix-turn-helix domain-containing protein [Candidatus Thorarchaeota archaeon]